jgi:hypothetical protein
MMCRSRIGLPHCLEDIHQPISQPQHMDVDDEAELAEEREKGLLP